VAELIVNNKLVVKNKGAAMTHLGVICLEELRKTAQNCQDSRYLWRDLKQGPQEYKAGGIRTRVRIRKNER